MPLVKSKSMKRVRSQSFTKKRAASTKKVKPSVAIMRGSLSTRKMYPLLPRTRTTVRYLGNFHTVNPGLGGTADGHVFSANGLYDPDITGTGHQPGGFDQLMAMYDQYTVIGAKISVDFYNTDNTNPIFAFVAVRDSTSVDTDTRMLIENGYVNYRLMNRNTLVPSTTKINQAVDIAKYLGRGDVMSDPHLKGTITTNPTEQVYFHVGAYTMNNVDGGDVNLQAVIEYEVVFHERHSVTPS
ncbi:MAG: putative capsid protein [Circoviridae sp.]|nr:MAG: putative capsid protein [Circoviridae sp.]